MIRTILALVFFALYAVFVGLPVMLFTALTGSKETLFRMGRFCGVCTLRIAGVRTRAEGLENIPAGTCLFAANHASNTDPPAIVGVIPRRVAILLKKSLLSIPIVGPAFRMGDFIPWTGKTRRRRWTASTWRCSGPGGDCHFWRFQRGRAAAMGASSLSSRACFAWPSGRVSRSCRWRARARTRSCQGTRFPSGPEKCWCDFVR